MDALEALRWWENVLPVTIPLPRDVYREVWQQMDLDPETFARLYPLTTVSPLRPFLRVPNGHPA